MNFPISYSSRTKLLTTRIPVTFSCTLAFSASYFENTRVNALSANLITKTSTMRRKPSATRKIIESFRLMLKVSASVKISVAGARMQVLSIIW